MALGHGDNKIVVFLVGGDANVFCFYFGVPCFFTWLQAFRLRMAPIYQLVLD